MPPSPSPRHVARTLTQRREVTASPTPSRCRHQGRTFPQGAALRRRVTSPVAAQVLAAAAAQVRVPVRVARLEWRLMMAPAPSGGHAIRDEQLSRATRGALVATAAQPCGHSWACSSGRHSIRLYSIRRPSSGGTLSGAQLQPGCAQSPRCSRRGGGARVAAAAGSESAISMCNENDQSHVCEQSEHSCTSVGVGTLCNS